MKNKIRVFLGAYLNVSNAQNLNCKALAQHLDKGKFEVHALSIYSRPEVKIPDVTIHKCFWPHRISSYLIYFKNIVFADVVYLPKGNKLGVLSFWCKLFNKKSISTIEGIFDEAARKNAIRISGRNFIKYYQRFDKLYSITSFMKDYNSEKHQLYTEDKILYLGTDSDLFLNMDKKISALQKVVMIGNDLVRKGIYDYLSLAKQFEDLEFHIVGSGNDKIDVNEELKNRNLKNVIFHGLLSQDKIIELLDDIQLHILPSRSEGFHKVILETASAAVPTIMYDDYGAGEWIEHQKNGFVVSTIEQIADQIQELLEDKSKLQRTSKNAVLLGKSFDWKNKIQHWEEVFLAEF